MKDQLNSDHQNHRFVISNSIKSKILHYFYPRQLKIALKLIFKKFLKSSMVAGKLSNSGGTSFSEFICLRRLDDWSVTAVLGQQNRASKSTQSLFSFNCLRQMNLK